MPSINIGLSLGGLVPWSSVDYPGYQAAVLFTNGCPWRCRYCHNSHLWTTGSALSWDTVQLFLASRVGLLDAVVISGGEPLDQASAVLVALKEIRTLGFRTAIHTAGVAPDHLRALLPRLDWVGLDIKAPFARYSAVTGRAKSGDAARRSVQILLESGTQHELRTTVHPALLSHQDIVTMVTELRDIGAHALTLKNFRPMGCPNQRLIARYQPWLVPELAQELRGIMPGITLPEP